MMSDWGLVTITGGKWTTYRRMAVDAVDAAVRSGGLAHVPSGTAGLKLHGWRERKCANGDRSLSVYGSDAPSVAALCNERPEGPAASSVFALSRGRSLWAVRHEAARCVHDVLARALAPLLGCSREHRRGRDRRHAPQAELGRSPAWQVDTYGRVQKTGCGIPAGKLRRQRFLFPQRGDASIYRGFQPSLQYTTGHELVPHPIERLLRTSNHTSHVF